MYNFIMQNGNLYRQKINKTNKKKKVRYSFLSFVFIICIIELAVSNFHNISKYINFSGKIKGLDAKKNAELNRNEQLKSEIENFDSQTTLEAIARNNLKMAGQDEILVIVHKPEENNKEEQNNNKPRFK